VSLFQAFLLGVIYYLANSWNFSFRAVAYNPIAVGFLTGLVLGDIQTGAVVGGTIGLVYIGSFLVGGSVPADSGMATIIGTSAAIIGGLDLEAALAVAVPVGLVGTIIHYTRMIYFSFFVRLSDKLVEQGKEDKLWLTNVALPQLTLFLLCVIPVTLACYYGVDYIAGFVNALSGEFLTVIRVAAGMLPAVGIAITLSLIFKGEAVPFFFIGFLAVSVASLTLVQTAFVAVLMAAIYIGLKGQGKKDELEVSQQ